jgi:transposase InsO family protein
MNITLHKNARTTPRIRAEIQASTLSIAELARHYNLKYETVEKWKKRTFVHDVAAGPKTLDTRLLPAQEQIVCLLRTSLLLSLDDLTYVARKYIDPQASRSAIHRLLQRENISRLADLEPVAEGEKPKKTFKDYEPGYVHVDVKYLPKLADQDRHGYLFVAIDRATRWVYLEVKPDKTAASAAQFMRSLTNAAPMRIVKVLTDNGKEFTDRFAATGERDPTGRHAFDRACAENEIEHRLIAPRKPQTNGMVERFNGRIATILNSAHFGSAKQLEATMKNYETLYNHHIPQQNIGSRTPIEAMQLWQEKKPELFIRSIPNTPGRDS